MSYCNSEKWLKSMYIHGSYRKLKTGYYFYGPPCIWHNLIYLIFCTSGTYASWMLYRLQSRKSRARQILFNAKGGRADVFQCNAPPFTVQKTFLKWIFWKVGIYSPRWHYQWMGIIILRSYALITWNYGAVDPFVLDDVQQSRIPPPCQIL